MKNIIKLMFAAFVIVGTMNACLPDDNHALRGLPVTDNMISFTVTPGADEFTFNYNVTVNNDNPIGAVISSINFGDGSPVVRSQVGQPLTGSHEIVADAGSYTFTATIKTPNGEFTRTQTVTLANDNIVRPLTGGAANTAGKQWKLGPWSALRESTNNHTGIGGQWWDFKNAATANDVFTFKANGLNWNGAFVYGNAGDTHMNESLGALFPDGNTAGSFVTQYYIPATNATWTIADIDGKRYMTITNGFLGYATTPSDLTSTQYEMISFSATSIRLVRRVGTNNAWCFELVPM